MYQSQVETTAQPTASPKYGVAQYSLPRRTACTVSLLRAARLVFGLLVMVVQRSQVRRTTLRLAGQLFTLYVFFYCAEYSFDRQPYWLLGLRLEYWIQSFLPLVWLLCKPFRKQY